MPVLHTLSKSPPPGSELGHEYAKKENVIQLTWTLYMLLVPLVILQEIIHVQPCVSPLLQSFRLLLYCLAILLHRHHPDRFVSHFTALPTPFECDRLSEESVVKTRDDCQPDSGPSGPDNLLVLESDTHVPRQMPHAVEAVEEERESKEGLHSHLHSRGPCSNGRHH